MTADLPAWLLARISEDEAVARAAQADQRVTWATTADTAASVAGADAGLFILFNGPARVLAQCAALRRIVERCTSVDYAMPSTHLAHGILAELAAIWADHPTYDAEWRLT